MTDNLNPVGHLSIWYSNQPALQSLLKLVEGGSTLDTLLQKRANEIKAGRVKEFFDELGRGEIVLTEELINSEPFLHSFFRTMHAVNNTQQREKVRLFARLLRTSISPSMLTSPDECEEMVNTLDEISFREFGALYSLYRFEQGHFSPPAGDPGLQIISMYWHKFVEEMVSVHGIPAESVNAFMARLERTGLYLRITGAFFDYGGDRGRTTPLFKRLLDFVEDGHAEGGR